VEYQPLTCTKTFSKPLNFLIPQAYYRDYTVPV